MLSKIKKTGKKYENIIVLLFITIAVTIFSYNIDLKVEDELWNFSNIYKMMNGYEIYKDLNVIITPLFFYIGKIIFGILGSNYFVARTYNTIICIMFFYLIYKIFRTLGLKRYRSIFYLIAIYIASFYYIIVGLNYNSLAIDFWLIGLLLILKQKTNWMQGIVIFLIFMTKQNMGIYYTIGYIIYQFIQYKNIRKTIKAILPSGLIAIGLFGIYCICLCANQNLYNFINYTFLGIAEFGTKNLAYDGSIYILITIVLIYPIIIWMLKSKDFSIDSAVKEKGYTLISLAAPALLIAYPLMNKYHVILAIIPSVITFIYIFEKNFLEEVTSNKIITNIIKTIIVIYTIGIIVLCCYTNISYYIHMKNYDYYEVYYGAVVTEEMRQEIDEIVNYITENENEGKKVIVLSYYADLYMNILGKNNGKMDLPFYGNLGKEGEDGLIREIDELKNTNLLILKEEDTVFQESEKVREHIMNTYEQIGEIGRFFIYKVGY